jgi:hypothetical protein
MRKLRAASVSAALAAILNFHASIPAGAAERSNAPLAQPAHLFGRSP